MNTTDTTATLTVLMNELVNGTAPTGGYMLNRGDRGLIGALDKLTRASVDDLAAVEGVGETWASTIKDALSRIAESSILDRYA